MKTCTSNQRSILLAGLMTTLLAVHPAVCLFGQEEPPEEVRGGPQEGDEFTATGEGGAALPEMVVEAQNKVQQDIRKGESTFALDAAAVDSFFTSMDEEALGVSPVSGLQPHLNNLETLASDQPLCRSQLPHPRSGL